MNAKKAVCILLCIALVMGLAAGCGVREEAQAPTVPAATEAAVSPAEELIYSLDIADSWKQELLLADYMGLPMEKLEQETISGTEMAELLDALIAYEAPDRLSQWQALYPAFRAYGEPLPRIDVQSVLYLAVRFLGGAYTEYAVTIENVDWPIIEISFGEADCPIWELYGDVEPSDNGVFGVDHFGTGGTFYNHVSISPVSGERPMAYDSENNAFHMAEPAAYLDSLLAIARAAAIVHPELFEYGVPEEEQAILDMAADRRTAIFSTESDWSAGEGGTVYYVSPTGDDSNDGLSPETAWKTLGKLNSASAPELQCSAEEINIREFPQYQWAAEHPEEWITLNPGDVVLFERGGSWRGGLITAKGVTYSAYGEGPKPEILGSPENGSGAEKWTLLEGTDNIWVYYKDMQECGGILLDGETFATKYAPFWDEEAGQWRDFGEYEQLETEFALAASPFDVRDLKNLRFFNDLEDIRVEFPGWCWGKLYLRCDEGNPGQVYSSIEFFSSVDSWNRCVLVNENATLDNLCTKYFGSAVSMEDGATVQNCVVEYHGGIVQAYHKAGHVWEVVRTGECITAGNSNTAAINNYVAYAYDSGISVENGAAPWMVGDKSQDYAHRNVTVSGNLAEYCGCGLLCVSWTAIGDGLDIPLFGNVLFDDNYVLYEGMGWSHENHYLNEYSYLSSAMILINPGNSNQVQVTNNTFYDCWDIGQLVRYGYYNGDSSAARFSGNTYVSRLGGRAVEVEQYTKQGDSLELVYLQLGTDASLKEAIAAELGDSQARVLIRQLVFSKPE